MKHSRLNTNVGFSNLLARLSLARSIQPRELLERRQVWCQNVASELRTPSAGIRKAGYSKPPPVAEKIQPFWSWLTYFSTCCAVTPTRRSGRAEIHATRSWDDASHLLQWHYASQAAHLPTMIL